MRVDEETYTGDEYRALCAESAKAVAWWPNSAHAAIDEAIRTIASPQGPFSFRATKYPSTGEVVVRVDGIDEKYFVEIERRCSEHFPMCVMVRVRKEHDKNNK